jgi:hypothetical protein
MTHEAFGAVLTWALIIIAGFIAMGATWFVAGLLALDVHAKHERRRVESTGVKLADPLDEWTTTFPGLAREAQIDSTSNPATPPQ